MSTINIPAADHTRLREIAAKVAKVSNGLANGSVSPEVLAAHLRDYRDRFDRPAPFDAFMNFDVASHDA